MTPTLTKHVLAAQVSHVLKSPKLFLGSQFRATGTEAIPTGVAYMSPKSAYLLRRAGMMNTLAWPVR